MSAFATSRSAARGAALTSERKSYYYGILTYSSLARAQLALDEPASEIERTLEEFSAAIEHTGMHSYDRHLAELRTLLAERAP